MKLVIIFLLLSVNLLSQNFLKLYSSEIPDHIKIDPALSTSLKLNIKRNISLSPELISLTLEYYQSYNGKNFNTQIFENLKQSERIWFVKRNDWVRSTKEKILQNENFELTKLVEKPLDDLIVDVRKKDSDSIQLFSTNEFNKKNFYIVKFYLNDPELIYDMNNDYSKTRENLEADKIKYFKNVFENPKLLSSTQEFIQKVIENWYLFTESNEIDAAEILIKCIDSENIIKGRKNFSLFFGGVFINKIINLDEDIQFPDLDRKITINTESSIPQLTFGIGYKLYFKKNASYFSFIDFQLFYSFGYSSKSEDYQYNFENIEYNSTSTVRETISSSSTYKLSSFNSLGLKIATPIYQLDFLSLELALNTSWDTYWFDPDIVFTHSKIRKYNDPNQNSETLAYSQVKLQSPKTKHQISFMPMIDANLRIDDGFNTRISFGYGYFTMALVYYTSFLNF